MLRSTFVYQSGALLLAYVAAAQSFSITPQEPSPSQNPCQKLPINNITWQQLKIDQLLASLPNGQNITINEYAKQNAAENFICGIGEYCNANQLCHPVKAPAWQVLFAVQEYNHLMNAMSDSINNALSQLQPISASMLNDLSKNIDMSRFELDLRWLFTDVWRGVAYGAVTLFALSIIGTTFGPLGLLFTAANLLALTALGIGVAAIIQGRPHTVSYESWTNLSYYIGLIQASLTRSVTEALEGSLKSGLNSPKGLANVLRGGNFFIQPPTQGMMAKMEQNIQWIFQGRMISRILRSQNAYVLAYHDECKGPGPGGAPPEANVLSYCDSENKVSYNIVRAHKKKTHRAIYNAAVINNKYGFSTEFMTKNAVECQAKYGKFEHDTAGDINGTLTGDSASTDCIFNLPFCDFRKEEIKSLKYDGHKSTAEACRRIGAVPI